MKVRTEAKREAILATAGQVFMEMGYERASMAEIAQRVGGSKATLYGYFPSKAMLFAEVTLGMGRKQMEESVAQLTARGGSEDPRAALQAFGEGLLAFLCRPESHAIYRMVLAEAGRSEASQLFYEAGPKLGLQLVADFLKAAMEKGQLRQSDAWVASHHFMALINAERYYDPFLQEAPAHTRPQIRRMVERALDTFFGGYQAPAG